MTHTIRYVASVAVAVALLSPARAEGQTGRFLTGLGYGTVGATVGLIATADAECTGSGFVCIPASTVAATLGGLVLGAVVGAAIANAADRSVEEGKPIQGAHLAALSVGTVLGGATVGVVLGAAIADRFEGGDDTQIVVLSALVGAALGVVRLRRSWGRLTGAKMGIRPALPALLEGGRPGVVAGIRF